MRVQCWKSLRYPMRKSGIRPPYAGSHVPLCGGGRGAGIRVIIAGAGGAAHLPGMVAAKTILPVIGVPVQSKALNGLDSLLSIVQMPGGIPVATVAIGKAGAVNAGLLAAQIIGTFDPEVQRRAQRRRDAIRDEVLEGSDDL